MFWLILFVILVVLLLIVMLLSWLNADHPNDNSPVNILSRSDTPILSHGQELKVMTYNVQYLAGKNYVFFHDTPDLSGKDTKVDYSDVLATADGIARIIIDESPDIILFQELDDGSTRTNYEDQLELILSRLPRDYGNYASAFYWKVRFIPHPKIFGSLGMKAGIISKYKIKKVVRHNLPTLPVNFFLRQFSGQKMILQALFPLEDGSHIAVMNTHLDAFTVGSDIMTKQLEKLRNHIINLESQNVPWILGGDFNLLPPGQFEKIVESHRIYYNSEPEIKSFYNEFNIVPPLTGILSADESSWYTYYGNDPILSGPDRTLDYIVYSEKLKLINGYVRQMDTQNLSDHLPVIATFEI